MKNQINSLFMGLALLFFATSCDMQNNQFTSSDGNAKVNVYLIDAPANYDEVWVEVLGVEILPKGGNEENGNSWINLAHESEDKKINLLSLVGGNSAHLGEIEVPSGKISQIRLLLGEDNYIIQDGQRIDLKTPSAQQSGLKLKIDKPLNPGISYDLIIDFDASKSIVKAGNSGQYILKPVLRVVAEESSTIEGTILPLEAGPVEITAVLDEETVGTFTDQSGKFVLRGLKTGSYILEIVPNENYVGVTLEAVETETGKVTLIDPIQLDVVEESSDSEG
ncbi:DUF4382 domain-containing protein [Aquiflexum sp.]|uniref:DUF4382 domain-containing protein n=1 Tax=Aquiflexum sp. TaxID=1872584 RepID=UPI003593EFEB